jgi:hypothetical protein
MAYTVFPVAASGLHAPISVFAPRTRKPAPPTRIGKATPPKPERDFRAHDRPATPPPHPRPNRAAQ